MGRRQSVAVGETPPHDNVGLFGRPNDIQSRSAAVHEKHVFSGKSGSKNGSPCPDILAGTQSQRELGQYIKRYRGRKCSISCTGYECPESRRQAFAELADFLSAKFLHPGLSHSFPLQDRHGAYNSALKHRLIVLFKSTRSFFALAIKSAPKRPFSIKIPPPYAPIQLYSGRLLLQPKCSTSPTS